MIKSLTSLRFIFAIMIFMHHYSRGEGTGAIFPEGFLGVTFFFILSGFVLSYSYWGKLSERKIHFWDFLKRRVIKLYPLHLLCLFVALVFSRFSLPIKTIIPNMLLLQSWIPIQGYYFSGNAVSWCLSNEIFFYFIFPMLVVLFGKFSLRFGMLFAGGGDNPIYFSYSNYPRIISSCIILF
ncbi:hypothetical protein EZS27_010629 [termite gut metagenome]|uniref:Acyltransferase 3 domain-containing protein n=1 Tax=termite gut metagenome TaxID=433724 RepID=A0A5J4S642_9ZZZZ